MKLESAGLWSYGWLAWWLASSITLPGQYQKQVSSFQGSASTASMREDKQDGIATPIRASGMLRPAPA